MGNSNESFLWCIALGLAITAVCIAVAAYG